MAFGRNKEQIEPDSTVRVRGGPSTAQLGAAGSSNVRVVVETNPDDADGKSSNSRSRRLEDRGFLRRHIIRPRTVVWPAFFAVAVTASAAFFEANEDNPVVATAQDHVGEAIDDPEGYLQGIYDNAVSMAPSLPRWGGSESDSSDLFTQQPVVGNEGGLPWEQGGLAQASGPIPAEVPIGEMTPVQIQEIISQRWNTFLQDNPNSPLPGLTSPQLDNKITSLLQCFSFNSTLAEFHYGKNSVLPYDSYVYGVLFGIAMAESGADPANNMTYDGNGQYFKDTIELPNGEKVEVPTSGMFGLGPRSEEGQVQVTYEDFLNRIATVDVEALRGAGKSDKDIEDLIWLQLINEQSGVMVGQVARLTYEAIDDLLDEKGMDSLRQGLAERNPAAFHYLSTQVAYRAIYRHFIELYGDEEVALAYANEAMAWMDKLRGNEPPRVPEGFPDSACEIKNVEQSTDEALGVTTVGAETGN
jgi:hypothetical protein